MARQLGALIAVVEDPAPFPVPSWQFTTIFSVARQPGPFCDLQGHQAWHALGPYQYTQAKALVTNKSK